MRNWTKMLVAVSLAFLFFATSLRADPELNDKQKIEQLQKDMKDLRDEIQKLKNEITIQNNLRSAAMTEQFRELHRHLDSLAQQQQQTIQRISAYAPQSVTSNAAPPTSATVTVENQFHEEAHVTVNGSRYTVAPFQTIQVPRVATGTFEYSVEWNGRLIQPPRLETLRPVGYVIRIFPRM